MSREWKPGDVALVGYRLHGDDDLLQEDVRILRSDGKWYGATGWVTNHPEAAVSIRPLVVIDPEDREQVERLTAACLNAFNWTGRKPREEEVTATQAALRSLLAPPKPDEPMHVGAVVVDSKGTKYVRVSVAGDGWMHGKEWQQIGGDINAVRNFGWDQLDVVRVLTNGYAEGER
jgi:hypothetical protein